MASSVVIRRKLRQRSIHRTRPWVVLLLSTLALFVASAGGLALAGSAALVAGYQYFAQDLPAPEQIAEMALTNFETTRIYDRTGRHLLYEVIDPEGGDRIKVPFRDIPEHMRNATVALEDKTFYTNPAGINVEGILRAVWNNLQGLPVQGGSSITAQLVRNVAMDPEERFAISYARKIKEAILSYELTRRYPGPEGRDRILEWYLNTVHFGRLAYGVEAAAKLYFGKHAKDLTLAEAAMLAAVPQYPAKNPIDDPEAAKARQLKALQAMVSEGYITQAEADAAARAPLGKPEPAKEIQIEAPHFVMYLLPLLEERYGRRAVYGGGLRVITTLDLDLQKEAERIVREHVRQWDPSHKARNAAAVIIRPSTGEILAMVGSVDFHDASIDGQVNMAVEPRQPGSSFKPYTYAAAFEQGYAPATLVYDVRTSFAVEGAAPYVPENFDRKYHGPMSLRKALACSYNIPAVSLLEKIGIDSAVEMAHRLGITTLRDRSRLGLSVTLGGGEVRLLEHTYAMGVFANGGMMAGTPVPASRREPGYRELDPVGVLKVTDSRGNVIDEFKGPTLKEVLTPQVAYMITNVLSDNVARAPAFGTESALKLSRPAAGKTGTTNNYVDAWTVGYTPQLAVGVWVGNSDYTPMQAMWGGRGAAPIWHDIMEYAHQNLPVVEFVEPPGMKWVTVDAESGLLPGPYTRARVKELFIEGREPTMQDNLHKEFAICRASGKLATNYCPPEEVERQVYAIYPSLVSDWVRSTEQPHAPASYCDQHGPNLRAADASITFPGIYQPVGGVVQITGNARIPGFREYQVEYGTGLEPVEWFPIGGTHYNWVDNQVLEIWDASALSGLYTLRLTVRGDQERRVTLPVTVDNTPPEVAIINPEDGQFYVKEFDDYVNVQVSAVDNMAMDRVEYYVDDRKVGESRVAPYSLPWTLVMTDARRSIVPAVPTIPEGGLTTVEGDQIVTWRQTTYPDRVEYTREVGAGEAVSRTLIVRYQEGLAVMFPDGWGAMWMKDAEGLEEYREIHTLHAIAYDAAGNQARSEP
ncbi:MAG: transglycosylase domain-containing protein, partial [Anaerolineae bacterium]|nr:transglycosylase domain-containing protein [Anaerolineae bacterium]